MKLFRQTTHIESNKTKEETIVLIDRNIEPFHKDGSNLKFEGRVTADGEFKINLAEQGLAYRKRPSFVMVKGKVLEKQPGNSITHIEFSVSKLMIITMYGAGVLFALIAILLYLGYIILPGLPNVWLVPPIFYVFFLLNFYVTFITDKKNAVRILRTILQNNSH